MSWAAQVESRKLQVERWMSAVEATNKQNRTQKVLKRLVCLVELVRLVCLVCLVCLDSLVNLVSLVCLACLVSLSLCELYVVISFIVSIFNFHLSIFNLSTFQPLASLTFVTTRPFQASLMELAAPKVQLFNLSTFQPFNFSTFSIPRILRRFRLPSSASPSCRCWHPPCA